MTALRRVDPPPTPGRMVRVMSRVGTTRVARFISRHGKVRRNAVIYFHDGDRVIIAALRRDAEASGRTIPLIELAPTS